MGLFSRKCEYCGKKGADWFHKNPDGKKIHCCQRCHKAVRGAIGRKNLRR
jgi:ribosome-binding protein aMBF1 (putative translation factor)